MSRIFITGSTDGLGKALAEELLWEGHDVVLHARNMQRAKAINYLKRSGASIIAGDLSIDSQVRSIAESINNTAPFDVVVHNAGVGSGSDILNVNVLAPFMLSALIERPARIIFLSSSMHYEGHPPGNQEDLDSYITGCSYSDSKFLVTALALTLSRLWHDTTVNAVDPGWVPTKMGGRTAPDDFGRGYEKQKWLAVSTEAEALTSGGYWHYKKRYQPHELCSDTRFQSLLIEHLEKMTGIQLKK